MRLDVGCGAFPTGDVNIDLLLPSSDQKWNQNPKGFPNFVKATAECLPFKDHSFEEVYCSHVLEHLANPNFALREMLRVSNHIVKVVLPCSLFTVLDVFNYSPKNIYSHILWLRKNHKQRYWLRPLPFGTCSLHFVNLKEGLLYKRKAFGSKIKIPLPFETETVILK